MFFRVKSRNIKEPIDIKYQEFFSRDDFFTYVMNSMPDLDSELAQNVNKNKKLRTKKFLIRSHTI